MEQDSNAKVFVKLEAKKKKKRTCSGAILDVKATDSISHVLSIFFLSGRCTPALRMAPCNSIEGQGSSCNTLAFLPICNFTLNTNQAIVCLGGTSHSKHITKSQRMKKKEY